MEFLDYYLKAARVIESCETPRQMLTALKYIKLLKKKFPKEESINNLINIINNNLIEQLKPIAV